MNENETTQKERNAALIRAAKEGDVPAVRCLLLAHGAEVASSDGPCGQTLIEEAAGNDNIAMVQLLLDNGADINTRLGRSRTGALHVAVERGDAATLRLLLALGADIELGDAWGRTPLILAAVHNRAEELSLLLDAGAKLETGEGKEHHHVLESAAGAPSPAALRVLLERGAVSLADCERCWLASYRSFDRSRDAAEVVALLVDAGVTPWLRWEGTCSLVTEVRSGRLPEIARELRARGYEC